MPVFRTTQNHLEPPLLKGQGNMEYIVCTDHKHRTLKEVLECLVTDMPVVGYGPWGVVWKSSDRFGDEDEYLQLFTKRKQARTYLRLRLEDPFNYSTDDGYLVQVCVPL